MSELRSGSHSVSRFTPETPPDPSWVQAAADLSVRLEQMERAATTLLEQTLTDTIARLLAPVAAAIERAADIHRGLIDSLLSGVSTADQAELWQLVREYRGAVSEKVLEPVRASLDAGQLGSEIGELWVGLLELIPTVGEGVEEVELVPEEADLFAPEVGEPFSRRLRKAIVRGRRSMGRVRLHFANRLRHVFRRQLKPMPGRGRTVLVGQLVDYHLSVRVPRLLLPMHERFQQQVAQYLAELEGGVTAWSQQILELEHLLDRACFHCPAGSIPPEVAAQEADTESAPEADPWHQLRQTADSLQAALLEGVEVRGASPASVRELLASAWSELSDDVRDAGTVLLGFGQRRLTVRGTPLVETIKARQGAWAEWHRQTVSRIILNERLIALREELLETETALLQRIAAATLSCVQTTFATLKEKLRQGQAEADQACERAENRTGAAQLAADLNAVQERVLQGLSGTLGDLPGIAAAHRVLADPGRPEWARVLEAVQQLPDRMVVHVQRPEAGEQVELGRRTLGVDLRQIAEEALSPPWPQLLENQAEQLRQQLLQVWNGTEQIENIVQFNLGAAVDELQSATGQIDTDRFAGPETETTPAAAIGAARELAADALRRSSDTLDDLADKLWGPWGLFAEAVFNAVQSDWKDLHERVVSEDVLEGQWVDFRTQLKRRVERASLKTRELWKQGIARARRSWTVASRKGRELIRHGRSAVGVVDVTAIEPLSALDVITSVAALREQLPLVYRKLFTFGPLSELSLHEGRSRDLVRLRNHFENWKKGTYPGAIVLASPLGSGRTSFLNIITAKLFDQCDVRRLTLRERIYSEASIAALIAELLQLESRNWDLEQLEEHIRASRPTAAPTVMLIDDLEHLLLRTPGGSQLIERVLIFFSRTDTRLFWIATVGTEAWEFVGKTAAGAASCVTTHILESIDRKTVEDIIVNRHRRSGMALHFAQPTDPSPLLRRRLRRARTEEKRQELLRNSYFDQLHKQSGQSIMLALFYWLRSGSFDAEGDTLFVNAFEPVDFRFLTMLDLTHAFTLKAFLLHCTLTLDEHNRIFRMSSDQSTYLFESLLNLRIIEPSRLESEAGGSLASSILIPERRYRVRPLVLHPVTDLLRSRHILY